MRTATWKSALVFCLLAALFPACAPSGQKGIACYKGACFDVELAYSPQEKAMGLMFREKMEYGSGMLFIYETGAVRPFWMKNTYVPLDIIWLDANNTVVYISENTPPCAEPECPSYSPPIEAYNVLEISAGASGRIGLAEGEKLDISIRK